MKRQAINPGGGLGVPLSSAVIANGFVFVSGHIGVDDQGKALDGIGAQTRKAMEDIRTVLQQAGSSMDKVVKTTVFLADRRLFTAMNQVYASFFSGDPPARSTVEASLMLEGCLIEVEAIALTSGDSGDPPTGLAGQRSSTVVAAGT